MSIASRTAGKEIARLPCFCCTSSWRKAVVTLVCSIRRSSSGLIQDLLAAATIYAGAGSAWCWCFLVEIETHTFGHSKVQAEAD